MLKQLEERLQQKSIRPTAMRLLVLEFLDGRDSAISLTDLENGFERSDRITLYRTLKTFEEKGLVHSIDDGSGAPKYALCQDDCISSYHRDLHVHFYCHSCKQTYCLPSYKIPDLRLPAGYIAEEASLLVKGQCERCRA